MWVLRLDHQAGHPTAGAKEQSSGQASQACQGLARYMALPASQHANPMPRVVMSHSRGLAALAQPPFYATERGLIPAGASSTSQIYFLHEVRATTAVVLHLRIRTFPCPVLLCLFIACHILKLHKSLARRRKQLSLGLTGKQWYVLQGL